MSSSAERRAEYMKTVDELGTYRMQKISIAVSDQNGYEEGGVQKYTIGKAIY